MKNHRISSSSNHINQASAKSAVATHDSKGNAAKLFLAAATLGLLSVTPLLLRAQESPTVPPPQISVTARGEVQVAPDRARVQVGVETQAKTAAEAGAGGVIQAARREMLRLINA